MGAPSTALPVRRDAASRSVALPGSRGAPPGAPIPEGLELYPRGGDPETVDGQREPGVEVRMAMSRAARMASQRGRSRVSWAVAALAEVGEDAGSR